MRDATHPKAVPAGPGRESGLTLLEILAAATILAIGACGLSAVLVNAMATSAVNRETATARSAARRLLEQIQDVPVEQVYSTFNSVGTDDPLGENTAPGGSFVVETKPGTGQTGDMTATVLFPESTLGGMLREDVEDPALGLPRDLNGDGEVDSEDHAGDYVVLPVRVRISWSGVAGERTLDLCSLLLRE